MRIAMRLIIKKLIIFVIVIVLSLGSGICAGSYKYLFELKTKENLQGELNQPAGVAVDNNGDIYVADTLNSRIVVFDSSGAVRAVFGKQGQGEGELNMPMALAVDSANDKVYVADSSNYRIQVFKISGVFLAAIDLNKNQAKDEQEVRPIGIAVAPGGNIYISDADNNYIRGYSPDGKEVVKFGGFGSEPGKFCIPVGLYVDKENRLFVVDMNNYRVQVLDLEGNFLFKLGEAGDTTGTFAKPKDVCIDEDGFIYVSDSSHLVVQVFDKEGKFVSLIGAEKDPGRQFASPFGLAVRKGRLYITDRWRNSIRVYGIK